MSLTYAQHGVDIMKTYKFTITLGNVEHISSELVDKIYEAGASDGLISQTGSVVKIDFDRRANSYAEAIQEAVYQIEYIVLSDGSEIEVVFISGDLVQH